MSDFYGTIAQILTLVSVFSMAIAIISLLGSIRDLRLEILHLRPQVESTESSLSDISFGVNLLSVDMEKMKRLRVSYFIRVHFEEGFSSVVCASQIHLRACEVHSGCNEFWCTSAGSRNFPLSNELERISKEEYDRLCGILGVD